MKAAWNAAMTAKEQRRAMEADHALPDRTSIGEELRRVDALYGEAVDYARSFMDNVRTGKPFDFHEATPLVNGFIDSIFRNDAAAAAISKLKAFDDYTYTHCINVSILAVILGKRIGYSRDRLETIGMAGMFHDVGKSLIPDTILNKPGALSDQEMDVMRTHPIRGYQILIEQPGVSADVLHGALEHHEKHDGSGYPRGLKGDAISDIARLLAVVDVYDALTSRRVYKAPMPPGKVLAMMYQWRVTDFHPNIVEQFIKSLGVYPVGSFVRLSDHDHAVVMDHNPLTPLAPVVRVVFDENLRPKPATMVDLAAHATLSISDVLNPDEYGIDVYALMQ